MADRKRTSRLSFNWKKVVRIVLFVLIFTSSFSCKTQERNRTLQSGVMNEEGSLTYGMGMLIEYYTKLYKSGPSKATDLILFIDSMPINDRTVYDLEYRYLKNKKSSLVFTSEKEIENNEHVIIVSVYKNRVSPKNGLFKAFVYFPISVKEHRIE